MQQLMICEKHGTFVSDWTSCHLLHCDILRVVALHFVKLTDLTEPEPSDVGSSQK